MEAYQELEKRFGEWAQCEHVVACSSGTAALHLALEALGAAPGMEVLVPDFTMVACARAVTMAGLVPVFVDCNEHDLLMDVKKAETMVTSKTVAIMPVHIYGRVCDMVAVKRLSEKYHLAVVEDAAEAHGTKTELQYARCWSFYKNKVVAGEEGGAVAFKNADSARLARQLRNMGFTEAHDYTHIPRGHNYRMSNAHASLILKSLSEVDANLKRRWEGLCALDEACPEEWRLPHRDVPWVYDFRIKGIDWSDQNRIVQVFRGEFVEARHGFKPLSLQPEYQVEWRRRHKVKRTMHSPPLDTVAARICQEVIYVPLSLGASAFRRIVSRVQEGG